MRSPRTSWMLVFLLAVVLGAVVATALWRVHPTAPALGPAVTLDSTSPRAPAALERAPVRLDTREVPKPPGIRGRIVDADEGTPIAGWRVQLVRPSLAGMDTEVWSTDQVRATLKARGVDSAVVRATENPGEIELSLPEGTSALEDAGASPFPWTVPDGGRVFVMPSPGSGSTEPVLAPVRIRVPKVPSSAAPAMEVLSAATTDQDGRFEFECVDEEGLGLELVDQPPLYARDTRLPLADPGRVCTEPITWRVSIVERAIVRGRVLDLVTGEAVPFLGVEIRAVDSRAEWLTTDAEGRFESTTLMQTGTISATFRDDHDTNDVACQDSRAQVSRASEPLVFHVAIGPTYRFTWRSGSAPDECRVRVRGLAPVSNAPEVTWDRLRPGWHALRLEGGAFVRLPSPVRAEEGAAPVAELVASDGLLRATVALDHHIGRGESEIPVAFDLAGVVHGRVLDAEGEPIAGARVAVRDARGRAIDETQSDEHGNYALQGLEPRAVVSVEVSHPDHASRVFPLALTSGEDVEHHVTLD